MRRKALVIVDMQNDFVIGELQADNAIEIIDPIVKYAQQFPGDVYFTQDTHLDPEFADYDTMSIEEKTLPPHCIFQTWGWEIIEELRDVARESRIVTKSEFGSVNLAHFLDQYEEIQFCGVCTDVCVLSNVIVTQSENPYAKIVVLANLCAGTTKNHHNWALRLMADSLLVDVEEAIVF